MNSTEGIVDTNTSINLATNLESTCKTIANFKVESQLLDIRYRFQADSESAQAAYEVITSDGESLIDSKISTILTPKGFNMIVRAPLIPESLQLNLFTHNESPSTVVGIDFSEIVVQTMPSLKDIFIVNNVVSGSITSGPSVNYQIINSTEKTIEVANANQPFYLVMSEGFNSNWQLQDKFGESLTEGIEHQEVNGWANAWLINPDTICSVNSDSCEDTGNREKYFTTSSVRT